MDPENDLKLFKEFPKITTSEWEDKIRADLKGNRSLEELIWNSEEEIAVKPFYRQEVLTSLAYLDNLSGLRKQGDLPNEWKICQDIVPGFDLEQANQRIISALEGGADAIRIRLKDAGVYELPELRKMLDGFPFNEKAVFFRMYSGEEALYTNLCTLACSTGLAPAVLNGSLGADPLGTMAEQGIPLGEPEKLAILLRFINENSPSLRVIDVNGSSIHNAGSTLVEELAITLTIASEYMAILTDLGIDPAVIQGVMQLSLATGPNYFMEIAKLRACRLLWAKISEAYGIKNGNNRITIHSTTSIWNLTLYDPYTNILRGTTQAMSSVLGGADVVSVLPFDYPYGTSSVFTDRVARNVQLLLREESGFAQITDPSAGAYYIEYLTDAIAERSWELFSEVELRGGFIRAFESGWIHEKIASSRKEKESQAASGKKKILGTSAFPDLNERILEKLDSIEKKQEKGVAGSTIPPLPVFRVSSMFEKVRIQTESSTKRPKVFLFKYGDPEWMNARSAFSKNFLGCAGYEITDPQPFETIASGIREAEVQQPDMILLCSTDDLYPRIAPAVAEAFSGKALIVVAGYPESGIEQLQQSGVTHFINTESDLLETLKAFNSILLVHDNKR